MNKNEYYKEFIMRINSMFSFFKLYDGITSY